MGYKYPMFRAFSHDSIFFTQYVSEDQRVLMIYGTYFWHCVYPKVSIRVPRVVGLRWVKQSNDERWSLYAQTMMEFCYVERCREYLRGNRHTLEQGPPISLTWYIEGLLCRYAEQSCMAFITSCGAANNKWLLVTPDIARLSMIVVSHVAVGCLDFSSMALRKI